MVISGSIVTFAPILVFSPTVAPLIHSLAFLHKGCKTLVIVTHGPIQHPFFN